MRQLYRWLAVSPGRILLASADPGMGSPGAGRNGMVRRIVVRGHVPCLLLLHDQSKVLQCNGSGAGLGSMAEGARMPLQPMADSQLVSEDIE